VLRGDIILLHLSENNFYQANLSRLMWSAKFYKKFCNEANESILSAF